MRQARASVPGEGPIRSMTGYGAARSEEHGLSVEVELRSVNHRFLQLKSRLPADYAALEPEVERIVRTRLARGAVALRLDAARLGGRAARLDEETVHQYARRLAQLAAALGLEERPGLALLAGLPGVFQESAGPAPGEVWPVARRALLEALDALDAMRLAEGAALARDLARRLAALKRLLGAIRKRAPRSLAQAQARLQERVENLLGSAGREAPAGGDLARELALLADRTDISEELARLASHLEQWAAVAKAGGEVGKRLDFLLQEVGREVNTIGSKAQDVEIAHTVVAMKTELEKAREQVQNLE